MTFHDETAERPSLFDRLFTLGDTVDTQGSVRGPRRASARARRESRRDGALLWALVSFQLGLSALSAALYETWFATWILIAHALSCVLWVSALRGRARTIASLARRAERAEESAMAKSALLATMGHELRTPLHGIVGMSSLLSRTALDARQHEHVETLRSCASSMLVLVNDVLDFARLEVGKLPVTAAPFEPRLAVDEVLAMNGPRAQEKDLELFAVVERGVPERVVGDMTRVRQALTNLVANAVKFTARGEIELRVSLRGSGRLSFSVSDTGIGIDPSARPRLFKPFSQADGAIGKDYGGSGLGLAICRRLVLAMGGSIDFESTPGIGSRFFFELPLPPAGAAELPLRSDGPSAPGRDVEAGCPARKQNVVLAIPHGGTREGVVEICARLGVSTRAGSDLSSLREPFDVAIVDTSLPAAELEALAAHPRAARILLIARNTTRTLSWARSSLSWPVRQLGLLGALQALIHPDAREGAREPHGDRSFTGSQVLVVEDTAVNRVVAEALLSELGLSVKVARDGEEALALLQERAFHLVLMDCQLPGLSGVEATRHLRTVDGPNQRTPVLALSAHAENDNEAACREAGMNDYLEKPLARADLIRKLERWLPADHRLEIPEGPRETHLNGPTTAAPRAGRADDLAELEDFLRDFERQLGSSVIQRLAESYGESVPPAANALIRATHEGDAGLDRSLVARHAHALRGAARSMGLRALSSKLDELERASARADGPLLAAMSQDIEARMLRVRDALRAREMETVTNREAVG